VNSDISTEWYDQIVAEFFDERNQIYKFEDSDEPQPRWEKGATTG
jgi:hypothetical protein